MASKAFNYMADDNRYKRDALILKKKLTQTPVGADVSCTPPISSAFGEGLSCSAYNPTHSILNVSDRKLYLGHRERHGKDVYWQNCQIGLAHQLRLSDLWASRG